MDLQSLGIDEDELCAVADAALKRVTPDYANARVTHCSVHQRPADGSPVILLHVAATSRRAARGQYLPLADGHDRGFADEYVYGSIHGYWLAKHKRDLFNEVMLILDVDADEERRPLYRYVPVETAREEGLVPRNSPLATALATYSLQWVPQAGSWLSGPSLGMIEVVAEEVGRRRSGLFLDAFAGSCALSRVALEHGADWAVCIDIALDEVIARGNLGRFASRAELRNGEIGEMIGDESFDVIALDPFYDHTLVAIETMAHAIGRSFECAVVNLGRAIPTAWQARLTRTVTEWGGPPTIHTLYGERIAVCQNGGGR
ncbi:MAG TPA: hypothetical protein VFW48_10580 [Solirubrobacterales bacterium]|nr:hypothetical protein [Solirubrobacterales bacterium]